MDGQDYTVFEEKSEYANASGQYDASGPELMTKAESAAIQEPATDSEPTAYDDVFRTLTVDCKSLLIPLINEIFNEHYDGSEEVVFSQNEHFLRQQDGNEEKRITDSSFKIIGNETKNYLFECQSTPDSSMLIRIFEYIAQIALDERTLEKDKLIIRIPNSAILFLRSSKTTSDVMHIEIQTQNESLTIDVRVMKIKSYTIDDIFNKSLYFLIPFYIFTYESQFNSIEKNRNRLDELKEEYLRISENLDRAVHDGRLSEYTSKTIAEMSHKVLEKICRNHETIKEEVSKIMGGRVLNYEAKDILNEGIRQGIRQGIQQGIQQGKKEGMMQGRKEGMMQGRKEGIQQGIDTILDSLVKQGILTFEQAKLQAQLIQ